MISFIIIGKNEGWRLKKCLQSVVDVIEHDEIADHEIIYVDSRSKDNSVELAKQYGAKAFLVTGECNAAIARNIGAREAMGDILFFIDGDMELFSGFLPKVLTQDGRLEYPFISGIFNDVVHDNDWQYLHTSRRHKLQEGEPDLVQVTTGGLFMIEHSLWKQMKGMDTKFKLGEDYDLGIRLSQAGVPLHRKAIVLANHYMRQYNIQTYYVGSVKYTALLLRKHWNNINYLKVFVAQQYTLLALVFSLTIMMTLSVWGGLLYLLAVLYKNIKQHNSLQRCWQPIARDMVMLWALFFFWPSRYELNYKKV